MAEVTNDSSLFRRFLQYQKERFPFLAHGPLIAVFTFSAVSYASIGRGRETFIDLKTYCIGVFATLTLFFLVRIFDEFKDKEDDLKYRTYLPVPRGLIRLKELRNIGIVVFLLQIAMIAVFQPAMFLLYAIAFGWLLLMGVEFFIPEWLRKHQMVYITSHMFIIPLIDMYASGLDWRIEGVAPPSCLIWFFAVSYFNGLVLEVGRKIRTPENEEEGVISYTGLYGTKGGVWLWLALTFVTMICAIIAGLVVGYGITSVITFSVLFILCVIPATMFLKKPETKTSKWIEYASAAWTFFMYLGLGAIHMITRILA
ncbi:MAG: hypothetical protein GC181_00980 [Bacteroidetes bacterium]|nr:hypothetical protein [Bacteroidota bacterium]